MKIYQNFKIYFTFILLWISIQFGQIVEDTVAFTLIISIGILHGANDILIISNTQNSKLKYLKNLFIYLLIILVCVIIFLVNPFLSILTFILLSSYHFGEEHYSHKIKLPRTIEPLFFISYGLLIFTTIFYESINEVNTIMEALAKKGFEKKNIEITFFSALFVYLATNIYMYFKNNSSISLLLEEFFYLILLFVIFKTSTLIFGFSIYFILWHSIPSIIHQIQFISGDLNKKNIKIYLKKAYPFWILSVIGLPIIFVSLKDIQILEAIVFVTLFAVTAPHVWVMYKMKN